MTDVTHITECGLPGIKRIPYGLHACHFYPTREALVEAVVPYFLKGLSQNERCLWITAPPLPAMEAVAALRAAWRGADQAMEKGALRVVDYDDWYVQSSQVKSGLLDAWLEEEKRARGRLRGPAHYRQHRVPA